MAIQSKEFYREKLNALNCCVIVPTYNNEKTILTVINQVLEYTCNLIVVNDGATDSTSELLKQVEHKITLLSINQTKAKELHLEQVLNMLRKRMRMPLLSIAMGSTMRTTFLFL